MARHPRSPSPVPWPWDRVGGSDRPPAPARRARGIRRWDPCAKAMRVAGESKASAVAEGVIVPSITTVTYDPKLVPVAPTQGAPTPIALTPFWIGSAPGSALHLQLPRVAPRHVAVMEREDGFYLSPVAGVSPAPTLNGRAVSGLTRMQNGDVIEIVPGVVWRLETGEPLPVAEEKEGDAFVPVAGRSGKKKKKRKARRSGGGLGRTIAVGFAALALAALLVAV